MSTLETVIKQSAVSGIKIEDVKPFVDKLTPLVDTSRSTIYWFRPYKANLYPEITIDTKYFFLYSTDHAGSSESAGGLFMGKGNKLDLSDFVEVGLILDGHQAETPFLYRFPNNERPIHLYYHTDMTDPTNAGGIQTTKLVTTTGGDLVNSTWVQEIDPLGVEVNDEHLGYLKFWNIDGNLIGTHYKQGSSPENGTGVWQKSTTTDGLSFVRGDVYDVLTNVSSDRRLILPGSWFFKLYGQRWCLATTYPNSSVFPSAIAAKMSLYKADSNLNITEEIVILNNNQTTRGFEFYIEDNIAHIYMRNYTDPLRYSTYNLNQLRAYL